MDNFFNRKNIKPLPSLQQPHLQPLQAVWVKFHHIPILQLTPKSSPTISSSALIPPISTQSQHILPPDSSNNVANERLLDEKRRKVADMESEIKEKDKIIQQLT